MRSICDLRDTEASHRRQRVDEHSEREDDRSIEQGRDVWDTTRRNNAEMEFGPETRGEDRTKRARVLKKPGMRIRNAGKALNTACILGSTTAPARMSRIIARKRTGKLSRTILRAGRAGPPTLLPMRTDRRQAMRLQPKE